MESSERLDRLEADLAEAAATVKLLVQATLAQSQRVDRHDEEIAAMRLRAEEQYAQIRELAKHNEERLGIVIKMMDEWIRMRGNQGIV